MIKNLETQSSLEIEQQNFPEADLLKFVEKIYAKAPTIDGVPNLKENYTKAICERNTNALKDLARALLVKLNYDSKYQGCEEDAQDYEQEKGYSWENLNSAHKQLQAWIEMQK